MLTMEDNEVLCRVGPGSLMGDLMRQYWLPAMIASELPSGDGPPVRLRLLGENLIAFRVTSGKVGIVANACPHRGASMYFGRNEEEGLRCVYHGWKFEVDGVCVDMPSEPAESNFKSKVRTTAYPAIERGNVIWIYMGPRQTPPPLPELETNLTANPGVEKVMRDCNWMQALEGDIDTCHFGFLHWGSVKPEEYAPATLEHYMLRNRAPRYSVRETEYGSTYGAFRPAEADTDYWRVAHFLFPFYTMTPGPSIPLGASASVRAWVPIDDSHTYFINISAKAGQTRGTAGIEFLPDTTDWLGKFRWEQRRENDYRIDRELQASDTGPAAFTGIRGTTVQDQAVTESMGFIYERTAEHLGTSDSMIIRTRRLLIRTAKALRERGELPHSVDHPAVYRDHASGACILPRGVDFFDGTRDLQAGIDPATGEKLRQTIEVGGR